MQSKKMAICKLCATCLALVAIGVSVPAKGDDVRRHCVLDWTVKAPADSSKISQGDIYDRLRYSTGATPFTYTSVSDDTSTFTLPDGTECTPDPVKVVTDEVVEFPTLRASRVVPFVRFSQPLYTNASNTKYIRSQKITLPNTQVSSVVSNELTIVMRMRWRGIVGGSSWAQIFAYGWTWAAGRGVCAYLGGAGSTYTAYPTLTVGTSSIKMEKSNMLLSTNRWYDLAYTLRQFMDGDTRKTVVSAYYCVVATPGSYTERNWITGHTVTNTSLPAIDFTGTRNWISAQDSGDVKELNTKDERHFRGDIQRIAVYSKELTEDEVRQAFTGESEEVSLGFRNAKADEFSDAATGEFDADTMTWHEFRKTLTAEKPSVVINKKLDSRWARKTHVLRFGVLPDAARTSSTAYLKISVNGARVGRVKLGPDGTNCCVCLSSTLMSSVMKETDDWLMSLKIERDEVGIFNGNVKFDYLSLGGPWQIGVQDDDNTEMGAVNQQGTLTRYHVAVCDDTKCARSTYTDGGIGYVSQKIYFTLSAEEAAALDFTFYYRSITYSGHWKIVVNGVDWDTRFFEPGGAVASRHYMYSWTFPRGMFVEGINCIEFAVPMDSGIKQWVNHDLFAFSVADFYPGSLYTGPLGLGTKIIFR